MAITLYPSTSRGRADYGWLKTNYSFSFANYYNPDRTHFGALRVLNDDGIGPGAGFPPHEHDNMEIITLVLEGALQHEDSMGNKGVVHANEVQVMSAGKGIVHSEFNHSKKDPVKLLQMWVMPNKEDVEPRYDQKSFAKLQKNTLFPLVSGKEDKATLFVHQDVTFLLGDLEKGKTFSHELKRNHGLFLFVIEGSVSVGKNILSARDAAEIVETDIVEFKTRENSKVLLIDVIHADD